MRRDERLRFTSWSARIRAASHCSSAAIPRPARPLLKLRELVRASESLEGESPWRSSKKKKIATPAWSANQGLEIRSSEHHYHDIETREQQPNRPKPLAGVASSYKPSAHTKTL